MTKKTGVQLALVLALVSMAMAAPGAGSIKVWYPLGYSKVDGGGHRYFAVSTDSYKFVYDLGRPSMTELYNLAKSSSGPNLLQTAGAPGGFILFMDGANKLYESHLSNGNALVTVVKGSNSFPNMYQTRMTFRQAGRAYYQIDVTGIKLASSDGSVAPVTVSQRFHLWPEKFYVETSFVVDSTVPVRFAEDVTAYNPSYFTHVSSVALGNTALTPGSIYYLSASDPYIGVYDNTGSKGSVGHICVNRTDTDSLVFYHATYYGSQPALNFIHRAYDYDVQGGYGTWSAGETHTIYSQRFFSNRADSQEMEADAQVEAHPATITKLTSSNGLSSVASYDNKCGTYRIEMPPDYQGGPTGNNYADVYQNHYETARLRIANNSMARLARIKVVRGAVISGSTPWAEMVVADAAGFPMGVVSEQNSRWEADLPDTFFACYTRLPVASGETKDVKLSLVSQNWGKKPIIRMQCQDLGAWTGGADDQQWMQSSIGQGENMVYYVQRVWASIEDARGLDSRPLGAENTWRDNCGGWQFLKLATGTRPDTQSMVYQKSGVNLFDFTLNGAMDDGSITSTVRAIAFPANECTRTFFHVRYDVLSTVNPGALPSNLRLFALGDENYSPVNYPYVAYTDASGSVVNTSAGSSLTNRRIGGSAPWACTYGANPPLGTGGNRGFVLRSYKARVNGSTNNTAAITLNAGSQTRLILTPYTNQSRLIAGDYFEFDLETVAYGTSTSGYTQMQTEAAAWGSGKPSVPAVYHGTKVSDFPARVDIGADDYADFAITGGRDVVPIEIGGFTSYTTPSASDLRVEELRGNVWARIDQSVIGRDWWQTEFDDTTGKYSFVLALHTDGSTRRLRVFRALNKSEAELSAGLSAGLGVFSLPAHAGGSYVAGAGNSPVLADEWLSGSVVNTAAASRTFTPFIRYAAVTDGAIHLEVNGANQTGTIPLPATGGSNVWKTIVGADVTMNAGSNTLKTVWEAGGSYLDWIEYRLDRPVALTTDDAAPVSDSVPFNISSNIPVVCAVTMRNTGAATWTAADGYGLSSDNELGAAAFHAITSDVSPGGSFTFKFTCAAPPAAVKLYSATWQMKRQGQAFGTPITRPLRSTDLVTAYESSLLVDDSIPLQMSVRESRNAQVTLRNTGTTAWPGRVSSDFCMLRREDATFGFAGGGAIVPPGVTVLPGQDFTFSIAVTAPSVPGIYTLRLRMLHAPLAPFGPLVVREIEVLADATPPGAPVVTDGGKYSTSFTTLTATWTASDAESGIAGSQYAIGISPSFTGSGLVRGWTDTGGVKSATASGLTLAEGTTYYFYVRSRNGAGMWSPVGVSDGITVVRGAGSLADVRSMPVGSFFLLPAMLVTAAGDQLVFIEETGRSAGMKLNWQGTMPDLVHLATVAGIYRGYVDYEPTADALSIDPGGSATARALGLKNASTGWPGAGSPAHIGLPNVCLLVRTWGRVTFTGSGFFLVDDGSSITDHLAETGKPGIKVRLPAGAVMPGVGTEVSVTGVCRATAGLKRWLMPRTASDILPL